MDRRYWQAIVHGVGKSQIQLGMQSFFFFFGYISSISVKLVALCIWFLLTLESNSFSTKIDKEQIEHSL